MTDQTERIKIATLSADAPQIDIPDLRDRLTVVLAAKYKLLHLQALGGMASIWLAKHRGLRGLFSIKVLHPAFGQVAELRHFFHREAVHNAALAQHPNVVPILDIDHGDGLYYLVMPYIDGWDLDQALKVYHRFELSDALNVALTVCNVLCYAEEQNILHGDIAAGNIRIDRFGHLRLLDFGLSRTFTAVQGKNRFKLGTPETMSPEQIRGERLDIRSDLYSLGIVLFQMLFGRPPFSGSPGEELEQQHLHTIPELPEEPRLPDSLKALLLRLLAKAKEDRPSSAAVVRDALIALGATELPLAIPIPADVQEQSPLRRIRLTSPEFQSSH